MQNVNLAGCQKHENINKTRNDLAMEDPILAYVAKILPPSRTQMVINWLAQNLNPWEHCITHVDGSKNYASPSWFVLTNKRLIFVSNNLVNSFNFGECFIEFDLKDVRDGHFQKKTFSSLGDLQIITNIGTTVLDNVIAESAKNFISELLVTLKSRNQTAATGNQGNDDGGRQENNRTTSQRFQELNKLYHAGKITLEEYCATRTQITNETN